MKLDPKKLAEAHATLGRIVTVCKSGTPAAETVETLNKDLQQITNSLAGMLSGDGQQSVDPVGIKARIDEISGIADGLADSTYDLNMQDQIDALLTKVKELSATVEALPAPAQATKPTEQKAEGDKAGEPAEGDPPTTEKPAGDPAPAPAEGGEAKPEDEGEAAAGDPPAEGEGQQAAAEGAEGEAGDGNTDGGEAEGGDATSSEVVTKADLADFGKTIVDGFKGAMGELVTTLKSADTGRPQLIYPAGQGAEGETPTSQTSDPDAHDDSHWGNQFDLNAD